MAVRIADTLGRMGSGNYPLVYSTDVQIDQTDTRSVKEALGDAGSVASKTARGVVQIGDGINVNDAGLIDLHKATDEDLGGVIIGDGVSVDEGEISVPYYVEVGADEPTNKNMLWLDTSTNYNFGGDEFSIKNYNRYSEEEQVVGCWIDGRPIYRKVFIVESTVYKNTEVIARVYNVNNVTNYYGLYHATHDFWNICDGGSNTHTETIKLGYWGANFSGSDTSNSLYYIDNGNWAGATLYVIFEYTKTTDAENSFDESMMYSGTLDNTVTDADVEEVFS